MSHLSVQGNPFTNAETQALINIANGGGSGASVVIEEPSGSGTSFTITQSGGSLILFRNGVYQVAGGVNYTRSGTSLTLVDSLVSGEKLIAVIIIT